MDNIEVQNTNNQDLIVQAHLEAVRARERDAARHRAQKRNQGKKELQRQVEELSKQNFELLRELNNFKLSQVGG